MRVYQFRHIRAPRILAATRGLRHAARQPPCRIGVIPIVNRVLALLCAIGLCCLASACGSAAHRAAARIGGRAEQRGHRHPRVAARGGPHGSERQGRPRRDRSRAGALRLRAARRHPRRPHPLAVPARPQRRGRRRPAAARSAACEPSRAFARSTPARRTPSARSRPADVAKAAATWSTGLTNQGAGIKIAIIDDGVDQTHPYFAPAGYTMPAGFPKGQAAYTTAKVIVARAFAPAGITWKYARKPFDPVQSGHATHVAGIAAGNAGTAATGGVKVSGIAPRAYIGNYKALSVPTDANVGLDGNAPELVAAIEAAVADGMDVINLSLGEPEIEPSRDIVARALDAAAAAGVVPVVAAGNDFEEYGGGSADLTRHRGQGDHRRRRHEPRCVRRQHARRLQLRRPDTTVAAAQAGHQRPRRLDPVLGARRPLGGDVGDVDGDAADRRRRRPADRAASHLDGGRSEGSADRDRQLRQGRKPRGDADPRRRWAREPAQADVPLVLASPASVSFGILRPGASVPVHLNLADAGGGAGAWDVAVEPTGTATGAAIAVAPTVAVPGGLDLTATVAPAATDGDLTGFVRLTRGTDIRRIPFWLRVGRPALAAAAATPLKAPGVRAGNTRGKPSLVSRYRYPDVPQGGIVTAVLQGPEQVFRFTLTQARGELRRRDHAAQRRGQGRAADRRGRRREPPHRLRGAPHEPQSVSRAVRQPGARSRSDPAARGQLRHRLRQRHRRRGGRLRVPLLGRRHAAAVTQAHAGSRPPQRPARRSRARISAPGSTRPRSRRRSTAGPARRPWSRATCGSGRPASSPGSTGSGSRRPTTRSRATWRTCRRSCPTRACSRPRS